MTDSPRANRRRPRGPGRPSSADHGEDARRALLDAAAAAVAEHGYRGASVNEVIARAGSSKGTFYWHFESKDDLLFALLEERIDQPIRDLIDLLREAPSEEDMAPQASRFFRLLAEREPQALMLEHEYRALALRNPRVRKRYQERQAMLRDALAAALDVRAQHLGAPPFATPYDEIATVYLSLFQGLAIDHLIAPSEVPDQLLGEAVALIFQGLVARAERS